MGNIEFVEQTCPPTRIKVFGVGGGGCNAVDSMINMGLNGVDFCNINSDLQALALSKSPNKLHIGGEITKGMGCGGDPALGEKAALAAKDQLAEALADCEMVFIAAGLGGGTGTGAAPVVAEIAKSLGLLTVAIVTKPFSFEGPQRQKRAEMGLAKLSEFVDTKIVILNDKLIEIIGPKTPLTEAFDTVNRVLAQGVSAISDLIAIPGEINVDFMDVRTIMGETGGAVMGVGVGKGENRATESVKKACASPLQEKIVIEGARGVLMSITASADVSLQEITTATSAVYEVADPEADIIFGLVIDPGLKDEMRVTIIATGFPEDNVAYGDHPKREEKLTSPRSGLDLETKLKSMMGAAAAESDAKRQEAAHEEPGPRPVEVESDLDDSESDLPFEIPPPRSRPTANRLAPPEDAAERRSQHPQEAVGPMRVTARHNGDGWDSDDDDAGETAAAHEAEQPQSMAVGDESGRKADDMSVPAILRRRQRNKLFE